MNDRGSLSIEMTQMNKHLFRSPILYIPDKRMESDDFIYFQLNICSDGTKNESNYIRCKPKQTIGDAILDTMEDTNVTVNRCNKGLHVITKI